MSGSRKALATVALAVALALAAAAPATAKQVSSVLGVPCETRPDGIQACIGDVDHRVKTWDGVPLDVNVWLPPASQNGPFPLIVYHHGYGLNKEAASPDIARAKQGYVVMAYSARGFGFSCGIPLSRLGEPGCDQGWIHLDDARYEARDTQTLAGMLADARLVSPRKVGVTGTSYGGGISMILAALRNRIMRPDGKLVPWRSPQRHLRMEIAAAAPMWAWSDLSYALVPSGTTLDYLIDNPYGPRLGILKQSWVTLLYYEGQAEGYYAPPGADPDADITNWITRVGQGEPADSYSRNILRAIQRYHSAYYLQDRLPPRKRIRPAPILDYNAWTDDLIPADESLRYRNKVLGRWPRAEFSIMFAATAGHPRASITGSTPGIEGLVDNFFDRHLKGARGRPLGVRTYTQGCEGNPARGPFDTPTWAAQHPGEVRTAEPSPRSFTSSGGSASVAAAVDPIAAAGSNGCVTVSGADEANAATYRFGAAKGGGYTLIGSPTVIARIRASGDNAQIAARLWDIAPDGSQTFVTRALYRPRPRARNRQVFQLHPNGWYFAPGHAPKLELLGRDAPYGRPSNGSFTVTVSDLEVRLPVRERPGGQVRKPEPPARRDGLAFGSCTNPRSGTPRADRLTGTSAGDLLFGLGGRDRLLGRGGVDCLQGGKGNDILLGGPSIDVLFGARGSDWLNGGRGEDGLAGNSGVDRMAGGPGSDRIYSLDRSRDLVNCGPGIDAAKVDRRDIVRGCEQVELGSGAAARFLGRRHKTAIRRMRAWLGG